MKQVGTTHWVGNNNHATNSSGLQLFREGIATTMVLTSREGRQVAGGVQLRTAEPAPGSCL
jgi:hypothetical protein